MRDFQGAGPLATKIIKLPKLYISSEVCLGHICLREREVLSRGRTLSPLLAPLGPEKSQRMAAGPKSCQEW